MTELSLSLKQARLVHLAAQGLLAKPRGATRAKLVDAVARMQLLQIDTIHVVARSPYLTLFSRLGAYPNAWLDEALARGRIFETWSHEACFAPIGDYALHRDHRPARAGHWAMRHAQRMRDEHRQETDALLARIAEQGPVKSSDFERPEGATGGGWWGWKAEKKWLEALFGVGELMIARRERFHRVYDLRERVLAAAGVDDAALPARSTDAIRRELIARSVMALGVAPARWIADYYRLGKQIAEAELAPLVEAGELERVTVEGWDKPGYVHRANRETAQRAADGRLRATHTTLLSPFDPVVWDRDRALAFFDFDYRIECYTPEPKRRYGYFVLPILDRGRLVGRLDAKAHRKEAVFEVKAVFLEDGVRIDEALVGAVATAIAECAQWHATPAVRIARSEPRELAAALRSALR